MYQRIEDFSLQILAAIIIADILTLVSAWYEIYYVVDDTVPETVKAVFVNAAASVAVAILIVGTVDTYMVLSKLILEKYLERRFNDGKAEGLEKGIEQGREQGREQTDEEWRAWYNRMLVARANGDEFNESPPELNSSESTG